MFEIGPSLREARTRRGLSPEDVQKAIRIRDRYLHAIEEERWELLPGDAYAKGFLRTYAEFLGLNGNLYVDEYNSRYAHPQENAVLVPEAVTPIGTSRIGLLRPVVAIGAIVVAVAAVAAWQLRGSGSSNGGPGAGGAAPSAGASAPVTPAQSRPAAKPKHEQKQATQPKPAATATRAVLRATRGRVWLDVRSGGPQGAVLYEGVLEQGQTLPLTLSQRIWIRVGAPSNLDVLVGGKPVSGLPSQVGNVYLDSGGLSPAP